MEKEKTHPVSQLVRSTNARKGIKESLLRFRRRFARRTLFRALDEVQIGRIEFVDELGETQRGDQGATPAVSIRVQNLEFYTKVIFGGTIGAAESYILGHWNCSHLPDLVRIMALNRNMTSRMEQGFAATVTSVHRMWHRLRKNSAQGSRKNIALHYDLGNDFFELFLDSTMMYSAAIYTSSNQRLYDASINKLKAIGSKLRLSPTDHVLEIGTGWGGFATFAAQEFGCQVTTTTISEEQFAYTSKLVQKLGLDEQVTVLKQDYRTLNGRFDKLVSIEMIEAVGHEHFDTYFEKCSSLLKPDGLMLIQAITIDDREFDRAKNSVDFIQRYIFPGGCLPSVTAMMLSVKKMTDFQLFHMEDITHHYVRTLQDWRRNFHDRIVQVRQLGFSEEFIRMWDYYLCYCEGGFAERAIETVHLVLSKPRFRVEP